MQGVIREDDRFQNKSSTEHPERQFGISAKRRVDSPLGFLKVRAIDKLRMMT